MYTRDIRDTIATEDGPRFLAVIYKYIYTIWLHILSVTSQRQNVRQLDFFNGLSRIIAKKHQSSSALVALCGRESPMTDGFHSQRASYAENVYTSWRHSGHKWASYVSEHLWCLFINWPLINMSTNWFLACHPHHFSTRSSIDPFQHFPAQWNVDCSPLGNSPAPN